MARLQEGAAMAPQLAEASSQAGAPPVGGEAGAGAPPPQPAAPAQGAAPTPEAGAPAAPPPGAGAPPPGAEPRPQQGGAAGPASAVQPYLQQADQREQQEYQRAIRAMARVLYGTDSTADSIVDQINPERLVSDTAKVSMLFIKELDRAINMDEAVVAEVTRESVERIAELAEARHQIQYKPTDMEKILGATWEGVQSMFGNEDVQGYTQTVQSMRPQDLETLRQQQESILAQAKG